MASIADRVEKRRFLLRHPGPAGTLALALGVLVATDAIPLWMVFALTLAVGVVNAFDMPARQTFVFEMVGPDLLPNAVTLNSVHHERLTDRRPGIAGVLIATVGLAPCFIINGVSYLGCIVALLLDAPRGARPRRAAATPEGTATRRASATCGPTRRCAPRCSSWPRSARSPTSSRSASRWSPATPSTSVPRATAS